MRSKIGLMTLGFTMAMLALAIHSSAVDAGHYDVVPYATGTGSGASLLTGGYDDLGGLPTSQSEKVFGYDFGETEPYFAGDPGFNNGSTFTNGVFPNDGKLPSGSLVLSIFSGAYGSLRYWDGTGAANFQPVTGGIEINFNKSSSNLRVGATTTSGSLTIANIPAAGVSAGRVHEHLQSSIGVGGTGEAWTTLGAPDGIYAFGATLSGGGLVSDPIYFVFNQGMTETIHDAGIDFYSANVVPEPSTYAMALAGMASGGLAMWRRRKAKAT